MKYKVLISSSGTGSRLGELTKNKNKSLVKVGNVEVILRTIHSYPDSSEFIITLGYKGDDVEKFVKEKLPNRSISFVEVDLYEGKGSSLGYSLLAAESSIDCPFIFHCNDTLVFEKIPTDFSSNWIGWSKGGDDSLFSNKTYSSLEVNNGEVSKIFAKAEGYSHKLHIGLVGISDYAQFFQELRSLWQKNPNDSTLNDVSAIRKMIESGVSFTAKEFPTWLDTGNPTSLKHTEEWLRTADPL